MLNKFKIKTMISRFLTVTSLTFLLATPIEFVSTASVSLPADFLNLLLLQRGQQPADPCYDEFDKPRYCRPDFVNAALGRPVVASSECGKLSRGPETYCRLSSPSTRSSVDFVNEKIASARDNSLVDDPSIYTPPSSINRSCYLCDERQPKTSHSADLVTDVNDPRNATCWVSSLLPYDNGDTSSSGSSSSSSGGNQSILSSGNVTLTLSLGKRFEITYVSVTFCQEEPTAFSIWKSDDYGTTWQPFRMYARDCRRSYKVAPGEPSVVTTTTSTTTTTTTTTFQPLISGRHIRRQTRRMSGAGLDVVANSNKNDDDGPDPDFSSPTPGLAPTCIEEYGSSSGAVAIPPPPGGRNSVSLSESRVVFPTLELAPPSVSLDDLDTSPELQKWISATDLRIEFSRLPAHYSAASIAETRYFSVADLAVGGRCRCNGHASRCIPVPGTQRLQCDCRHNTQGEDCGQCKPFFVDRPWKRATTDEPNECVACNCNLHARQCRFNEELWQLSGQRSGGVCVGCRHNTAGRNCQYCREGYFRDHTKPITHRRACKVCECHPVGSLGKTCNQTTGQCPCKEGVEGISCSRCAPGYQQTNSPIQPCVKIVTTALNVPEVSDYQADDPYVEPTPHAVVRNVHYASNYGPKYHQQRAHSSAVPPHLVTTTLATCDSVCGGKGTPTQAGPRLSFAKWCQAHFAALIQLEDGGRLRVGSWTRLTARLYRVFARNHRDSTDDDGADDDDDGDEEDINDQPVTLPSGDEISIWVQTRALDCKCIKLKEGKKWLVTGRLGRVMAPAPSGGGRAGRSATPVAQFILDPATSAVVRWRPELETRLKKFSKMDRSGACAGQQMETPSTIPPTTVPALPSSADQQGFDQDDQVGDETVIDAQQPGDINADDYNDGADLINVNNNNNNNQAPLLVMPSVSRRSSPPIFDDNNSPNYNTDTIVVTGRRHLFHPQQQQRQHLRSVHGSENTRRRVRNSDTANNNKK